MANIILAAALVDARHGNGGNKQEPCHVPSYDVTLTIYDVAKAATLAYWEV